MADAWRADVIQELDQSSAALRNAFEKLAASVNGVRLDWNDEKFEQIGRVLQSFAQQAAQVLEDTQELQNGIRRSEDGV